MQAILGMPGGQGRVRGKALPSHDMFEARQMIDGAEEVITVRQHGPTAVPRSRARAIQKMREGLIGDVYMARGLCFKWRDTIGRAPRGAGARGVDYNLWLGPAPKTDH